MWYAMPVDFSAAECNYCVTRKELLAVVTFLEHFRQYLLGHCFTVQTDHGALTWLQNFKEPQGQLARWLENYKNTSSLLYIRLADCITMLMLCPGFHVSNVVGNLI